VVLAFGGFAAAQENLPPASGTPSAHPTAAPISEAGALHDSHAPQTHGHDAKCGCDEEEGHFFARAEYLLLQPRRRALDFAIVDPNRNGLAEGNVQSVDWDTNSGVRAGGGYRLGDHGWEAGAYYTYFYSSASNTVAAPPGGTLYATLTHPGFVDAVDEATGQSRLKYQLLDVEIGKHIEAGECFKLWLSAGCRLAWIDQTLSASYNGQSAFRSQVLSPVSFDGAGLRVGGEGNWKIARGFGLYAHAHGSLLDGQFRTQLTETNNANAAVISNVSEKFDKMVTNFELGLGLTWKGESLSARIGYEMSNWMGMVDSPDFVHDYTNKLSHRVSDLSLNGLAVRLEYAY